ncbi:MAG: hypothetical protein CMH31_02025 [Micavibrio sp.]|nr:hypothetical protein [Micavibrio sp.]
MKINLILLLIVLMAAGAYAYGTKNTNTPIFIKETKKQSQNVEDSNILENFTYERLNGKKAYLYDHKGRTTLLHFWATWCAPCLIELPQLVDLATLQPNIDILAISTDQNIDQISRFITKTRKVIPKNFILITDAKNEIAQDRFQTVRLPETFILTPALSIHEKIIGAHEEWTSPTMLEKLNTLSYKPE